MTKLASPTDISVMPRSRRYAVVLAALLLGVPIAAVSLRAAEGMREPQPLQAAVPQAPRTMDISVLETSVRIAPTANNRLKLTVGYINTNAPEKAIPILMSLIAEEKNNATAWNNLCVAHNLQKNYKEGITACTEALRIDPHFQLAANNLNWATEEEQKEAQQRTPVFPTRQAKATPPNQVAGFYLAQGLRQLDEGDYDAAIASWQRILALDPANALAANNIGTAYMFKKEPGTALEWFQRAVNSNPSLQIAKNNVAWATGEQARTGR